MGYKDELKRIQSGRQDRVEFIKRIAPYLVRRGVLCGEMRFPATPDPSEEAESGKEPKLTMLEKAIIKAERQGKHINRKLWKKIQSTPTPSRTQEPSGQTPAST